jgi:hypothetical protein
MLVKQGLRHLSGGQGDREVQVEKLPGKTRTTVVWHTPKGDLRAVTEVPTGHPGYTVEHFVKTDLDIERVLSVPHHPARYDVAPVRQMVEAVGERGLVYIDYPDPMYSVASLFDYEDFVVRCVSDLARIEELVAQVAARFATDVENLAATPGLAALPVLLYTAGPELATAPMLPPEVFARLVTPHQKRLVAILHARGFRTCIHCHGRVRGILDQILETGTDALEPIEPPTQGDIGLAELLNRVNGRLCLMGYVQDQDFYRAAPGQMRRWVEEVATLVDPAARYVMMPTCTPFQFPASPGYVRAYTEWIEAAAELLP